MDAVLSALQQTSTRLTVSGLGSGSAPLLMARAAATTRKPVLCITASEAEASRHEQDLSLFSSLPVIHYPGFEIPPYTPLAPDPATAANRIASLYQALTSDPPFVLVASIEALLRKTVPRTVLAELAELVMVNEEIDREGLLSRLAAGGYESVALVQSVGEFSERGAIIDIFAPGYELPLRLDFFGDTLESLRSFDPISQRSVEEMEEALILPASDILYPRHGSGGLDELLARFDRLAAQGNWQPEQADSIREKLRSRQNFPGSEFLISLFFPEPSTPFDYLPAETLVFLADQPAIQQALTGIQERIAANHQEASAAGIPALEPERVFLDPEALAQRLDRFLTVSLTPFAEAEPDRQSSFQVPTGNHRLLKQQLELERRRQGLLPPLARKIHDWLEDHDQIRLACRSLRHARHMAELLGQYGLTAEVCQAPVLAPDGREAAAGNLLLYDRPLSAGFDLLEEKSRWLSESELFGEVAAGRRRRPSRPAAETLVRFDELRQGDYVVHRDHGIGVYQGLITMELAGITNDFLQIAYRDDDKLYVPVDQLNAISKYKGISDRTPSLDKLGGKAWSATRNKVKKAVWQVAQDLLNLYARRQLTKGHAFSRPDDLYRELEESFPYDETPGQLKAINEVLADLTSEHPMDRLVCGDVGYGKTEVAIRAAFKVVEDGYQVALLVPTTVLAEQHAATFRERLAGFPVRIESLNRFRTPAEQKRIIADLNQGGVDIVIGTHRLLSGDVRFKRLGLLVIDEEHRFGVTHKEKLKKWKAQVDVLTLTATPIPRTLQLSLLGIRDLSVISSPPARRRTIKTFIARHDDLVIREAINRELGRGGQVFLVHNRVQSIHQVAARVQKLVPGARVAVAHGQMPSRQLEEIMVQFIRKEINVLVCTTIIESGLDIPGANTIIITRADRLGLAEIYQLRGRVGRSSEQAYAYLLVPSLDGLSKDAQQRLRALMDYNDLGGGFKLAMSDLQIRGGGNILGESQSGTIAAVGYDLYLDLLQRTVLDLKQRIQHGEESLIEEECEPEIKLRLSAYIPASYIQDTSQRYVAYRKLTGAENDQELAGLAEELTDRYGPLPREVEQLLEVLSLKNQLRRLRISRLEQGPAALVFTFQPQTPVPPERLLAVVGKDPAGCRLTPEGKLILHRDGLDSPALVLAASKKVLQALAGDAM